MDATSGGAFRRENAEEATQLIEELAKRKYKSLSKPSESSSRLKGGVIELNKVSAIEAKPYDLMNKMNT